MFHRDNSKLEGAVCKQTIFIPAFVDIICKRDDWKKTLFLIIFVKTVFS